MIAIQKIILQGNSAMVTLPRWLMHALKWRPGQPLILTLNEDNTVTLRLWRDLEMQQRRSPGLIVVDPEPVKQ